MNAHPVNIGFTYFGMPEFLIRKRVETWLPFLNQIGASQVIFKASFDRAIPEDVFECALQNGLEPVIHFTTELPLARKFNELTVLLDAYARWGVHYVILGNKPNNKSAWPTSGWNDERLADHFLDRFIPIASYVEEIGMTPVLPPLQPGGDYWDTAFLEALFMGLKRRQMNSLLKHIFLASYGYTFNKPLTWGAGGPERWSSVRPYLTPVGQQDQIGFNNYEWMQAIGLRLTGRQYPLLILDAGNTGMDSNASSAQTLEDVQLIAAASQSKDAKVSEAESPTFPDSVLNVNFALDTLQALLEGELTLETLQALFKPGSDQPAKGAGASPAEKPIAHYLLLPCHESGVSDVVLNKVKPVIKQRRPTIGFSLQEAMQAKKVSVFPDPLLFTEEKLSQLRSAGCVVEVLPQSGIEIATLLQSEAYQSQR